MFAPSSKSQTIAHVITKGKFYVLNPAIDTSHIPTGNNNNNIWMYIFYLNMRDIGGETL